MTEQRLPEPSHRARLALCPLTIREASAFVERVHRHHRAPRGGLFALGCYPCAAGPVVFGSPQIVGVVIVGRPVARRLQDGWTAEVTRCATDGTANACSFLYGAAWRAAQAHGFARLVTYTLPEEGGASLRGAGFRLIGPAGGGKWTRTARPRVDLHPTQEKLRWERNHG